MIDEVMIEEMKSRLKINKQELDHLFTIQDKLQTISFQDKQQISTNPILIGSPFKVEYRNLKTLSILSHVFTDIILFSEHLRISINICVLIPKRFIL